MPVCPAVNSVLAIGGVGGLAIGLAGREILENLFTGLIILSSSPFEVGEEVLFTPPSGPVRPHALQRSLQLMLPVHPCQLVACLMRCLAGLKSSTMLHASFRCGHVA